MWKPITEIPPLDENGKSKEYPVMIKGYDGWSIGMYLMDRWLTLGGNLNIVAWYDLPEYEP